MEECSIQLWAVCCRSWQDVRFQCAEPCQHLGRATHISTCSCANDGFAWRMDCYGDRADFPRNSFHCEADGEGMERRKEQGVMVKG